MDGKNKNQGFAILEILLVVVTLSFIVSIALVIKHHANDKPYETMVKTAKGDYVEITEWKVKLTVPDNTQKITYKVVSADKLSEILVSSEELDKFAADHKECANANQFVSIARAKAGQPLNGTPWDQAKAYLEQKGSKSLGLFYYYDGPRPSVSPCIGTNIAEIQKLNNQAYDLYDKLPTYKNVVINL
jgi:hypothetical protein